MARPKLDLLLHPEQKRELERLAKAPSTPQKIALRAKIVLRGGQGLDSARIAQELKTSRVTVGLWRQRFVDLGLAGLAEAPRPGRPATVLKKSAVCSPRSSSHRSTASAGPAAAWLAMSA